MPIPDRHYLHHLRWTSTGEVWASWRLRPLHHGRTPDQAHTEVHQPHATLFRALAGRQVLLQGLLTWTEPAEIVDRMVRGVDLTACPGWAAECDAVVDTLADIPFAQRRWLLHVRLNPDLRTRLTGWTRAALNEVAGWAALPPLPPSGAETAAAADDADRVAAAIPDVFAAAPLTEPQMTWARRHAQNRVQPYPDAFTTPTVPTHDLLGTHPTGRSAVGEPLLDPSGLTDLPDGRRRDRMAAPFRRRWLKVVTDTGEESYQAGLVLAQVPRSMGWPDCELLGRVDDAGVPVDLAIAATVRPRQQAMQRNKRALTQLNDQLGQVGDQVEQTGSMVRLHTAADTLTAYHADLQLNDAEVEVEAVILASTCGATAEDADQAAHAFTKAHIHLGWARPVGAEDAIFWAAQPAGPTTAQLRDYRHITHAAGFAAAAPLTHHRVGADSGDLLGLNITSPVPTPWYLDLFGDAAHDCDPSRDMSPTLAIVAEQGAGKSVTQKKICGDVVDRGGRMIATDCSGTREWFDFASSLHCTKSLVDVADPATSLDPLRMLPPTQAGPAVQSLLTTLLNVAATDPQGRLIAKVVKPAYLRQHRIASLGALHRHLTRDCRLDTAAEVADRLDVFTDLDAAGSLAAALFDPDLPAANLNARAIVIGTSNVALPTHDELASEHRMRTLGVDKLYGRALYALIARIAREVCFTDPSDPAVYDVDEAHHQTTSDEAIAVIIDFIRFGRKHRAALVTGSHDPETDYPSDTLRGLIKNRLVMRQPDLQLARRCARFLGFDPTDDPDRFDRTVADIRGLPAAQGVGVFKDHHDRVGTVQVLLPARPDRRAAVLSTPPGRPAAPR